MSTWINQLVQILRFDTNCQNKFIKSHLKNWYITICLLKKLFVKQFLQLIFSSLLYSIFFSYHNHVISHPLPCLILHYFSFSMIQYMHLWNIWCIHAHISPSSAQVDQYPYVKIERERENIVLNHLEQCIYKNWGHPDHQTKYRTELKQQCLPPI